MYSQERFDAFVAAGDPVAYVVTVAGDQQPDGCVVGFVTQCSISPPRLAVCLSKENRTTRLALASRATLALHRLCAADIVAAAWFGGETGDDVAKLESWAWHPGPGNVPLIDALEDRLVGVEVARVDGGDHVLFVLDIVDVEGDAERVPMRLSMLADLSPGHSA